MEIGKVGRFTTMEFHSHARGIMSMTTDKTMDIYSIETKKEIFSIDTKETTKQHTWSPLSGNHILAHSTSNALTTYDPRTSSAQLEITTQYMPNRPSTSTFLDDTTILTTGSISKWNPSLMTGSLRSTMSPTIHLYDLRNPTSPTTTIPLTTSSSPSTCLYPLIDPIRKLAYITGRHTSSLYALDFSSPSPMPTTLTLAGTILDAALLPAYETDVMRAEINRLYVLMKGAIVPVSVRVERKSYLDFHADLFPDVFVPSGIDGAKWVDGQQEGRDKISLDPERQQWRGEIKKDERLKGVASTGTSEMTLSEDPVGWKQIEDENQSASETHGLAHQVPQARNPTESISPSSPPAPSQNTTPPPSPPHPTISETHSSTPPPQGTGSQVSPISPPPRTPGTYTRSFLTGSQHHPSTSYTSLPPLPTIPSHRLLHATSEHLLFPIAGAGGRLVLLPLGNVGRYTESQVIEIGCGIVDFEACQYAPNVVIAGEDGSVRVYSGKEEKRIQVEKVVQVSWHPLASNVIGILCVEQGNSEFRVWNSEEGSEKVCGLAYPV